jgi:glucoamylase
MVFLRVLVTAFFLLIYLNVQATPHGAPGMPATWSSGKKTSVGTFIDSKRSLVWFSTASGVLTEVFYPTIDKPHLRDSQILVSDGETFFADEKTRTIHEVEILSPSISRLVNRDPKNRFKISHTFFTLENSSTLVDEVVIDAYQDNLSYYLLVNPSMLNTGFGDLGRYSGGRLVFWDKSRRKSELSLSISSNLRVLKGSLGYVGNSDGYQDLKDNFKMDFNYHKADQPGNLAGMMQFDIPKKAGRYKFYIFYKFNNLGKMIPTQNALSNHKYRYEHAWNSYFSSLKVPTNSRRELFLYFKSLYVLKTMEDKLNPGAFIASLSKPWGESYQETFENHPDEFKVGGYHLVWPRDLFHISLALLYSGDYRSPVRALRFLKRIQYKSGFWNYGARKISKIGALPQNTWVSGKSYWSGYQLDQVGYFVHLFYHLYKSKHFNGAALLAEFGDSIKLSLDFIKNYGPWTAQERWEEIWGISPSSFSVATSALLLGSRIFPDVRNYEDTALGWLNKPNDNIHTWTFSNNGVFGDGRYYLRVAGCRNFTAKWDPNDEESRCHVANTNGKMVYQSEFLDQGFLKLSLLGLVSANDSRILTSLDKVNLLNRKNINSNEGIFHAWHRYTNDNYGQDGGRLWPLLSGEHGRFYLERFNNNSISWQEALGKIDPILKSFSIFANEGLMLPEQIWQNGKGTDAATPLAWSHAEYIKLLWSKVFKRNVETILQFKGEVDWYQGFPSQ